MSEVEIICINKSGGYHYNPNEAIHTFGWIDHTDGNRGKSSRANMIKFLNEGNNAYVLDNNGNRKVYCYVRKSSSGTQFLQTYADSTYTNNLLDLPECK
jgi:hypothetical protein